MERLHSPPSELTKEFDHELTFELLVTLDVLLALCSPHRLTTRETFSGVSSCACAESFLCVKRSRPPDRICACARRSSCRLSWIEVRMRRTGLAPMSARCPVFLCRGCILGVVVSLNTRYGRALAAKDYISHEAAREGACFSTSF